MVYTINCGITLRDNWKLPHCDGGIFTLRNGTSFSRKRHIQHLMLLSVDCSPPPYLDGAVCVREFVLIYTQSLLDDA